jgi:hypothetical protein
MIRKNSGCELRAIDPRSTFLRGTITNIGRLRSVTTTIDHHAGCILCCSERLERTAVQARTFDFGRYVDQTVRKGR